METDARYIRPCGVDFILGDSSKAREKLGWKPEVTFDALVRMMVDHDLDQARREQTLIDAGHTVVLNGVAR